MKVPGDKLIPDIEILRAIAVLGVVFQHLNGNLIPSSALHGSVTSILSGGWVGVDLFFAISGYVIARSYLPRASQLEQFSQYRIVAYRFWVARLFRLAPSAWLWLLLILTLAIVYNDSGVFGTVRTNLSWMLSGILNYSNYLFVQYFGVRAPAPSFVYWSLSLEEQFYLFFPIVVWLFRRRVVYLFLALALLQVFSQRGMYGMMFRTDAIALGVVLAIVQDSGRLEAVHALLGRLWARTLALGLVCLLFYLGSFSQAVVPVQVGLVAVVSTLLVALCCGRNDVLAANGQLTRALLWLGRRSYAVYLIHIPAMFLMRETAHRLDWNMSENIALSVVLFFILTGLLAAANYRWIETPLRLRGKKIAESIGREALLRN